jgi:hypothetical protein|tara:strand:- start:117 stop:593 length:477 start_codon:yes stop_codon:yes gene_type:complete
MGFLNKVFKVIGLTGYSLKKSKELQRLQLIIWPPGEADIIDMTERLDVAKKKDEALEKFFELCKSDEGVKQAMDSYGATGETTKELYNKLIDAGAGQWIKGHFVALSALAYFEPLTFCLEALKKGSPDFTEVAWNMLEFFKGNPLDRSHLRRKEWSEE